jgi:hypothetical protein
VFLNLLIGQFFQPLGKQGGGRIQNLLEFSKPWKTGADLFRIARKFKLGVGQFGGFGEVVEIKAGQMSCAILFVESAKIPAELLVLFVGIQKVRSLG